jgi:hypothetical protein
MGCNHSAETWGYLQAGNLLTEGAHHNMALDCLLEHAAVVSFGDTLTMKRYSY